MTLVKFLGMPLKTHAEPVSSDGNAQQQMHWDPKFLSEAISCENTLYQMRLCDISENDLRALEEDNNAFVESVNTDSTCRIVKTVPYCEIVARQFKEEWGVHYVKRGILRKTEEEEESQDQRTAVSHIVDLELLSNVRRNTAKQQGDTPLYTSAVAQNPFRVHTSASQQAQYAQCGAVLSRWRLQQQKKKSPVSPKYRVTFRPLPAVNGVTIPYLTFQKAIQQQQEQQVKQNDKDNVPFYRKYWYIVLGVVILVISSAFGAPEEESK